MRLAVVGVTFHRLWIVRIGIGKVVFKLLGLMLLMAPTAPISTASFSPATTPALSTAAMSALPELRRARRRALRVVSMSALVGIGRNWRIRLRTGLIGITHR